MHCRCCLVTTCSPPPLAPSVLVDYAVEPWGCSSYCCSLCCLCLFWGDPLAAFSLPLLPSNLLFASSPSVHCPWGPCYRTTRLFLLLLFSVLSSSYAPLCKGTADVGVDWGIAATGYPQQLRAHTAACLTSHTPRPLTLRNYCLQPQTEEDLHPHYALTRTL